MKRILIISLVSLSSALVGCQSDHDVVPGMSLPTVASAKAPLSYPVPGWDGTGGHYGGKPWVSESVGTLTNFYCPKDGTLLQTWDEVNKRTTYNIKICPLIPFGER